MVAPFDMHSRLISLIERERDHARAGKPARIVAKLNALVDQEIIEKLYEASRADVTIDLIVRGICCLRPKMPGLSENIRVISIVGRFLEHSRIFILRMPASPECSFPARIGCHEIFSGASNWRSPSKTRHCAIRLSTRCYRVSCTIALRRGSLQPDGTYRRLKPEGTEPRAQAQWHFREVSSRAREKNDRFQEKIARRQINSDDRCHRSARYHESGN